MKKKKSRKKKNEEDKIEGNIIKEAFIEGHPEALSLNQISRITEQMLKSVCKIAIGKKKATGFICLIPNPKIDHLLKVLITCNHVLNDLRIGNQIQLEFNDKKKILTIDEFRKTYTNEKFDITIIELKKNEFDLKDYLKIDDLMYKENEFNKTYKDKQI